MVRMVGTTLCLVLLTLGFGQSSGQVLINEIMADPASDWDGDSTYSYRDDEWVEIYNAGATEVDLSTYWMGDADSTLLFNFSGRLGPGRQSVVYGSEAVEWQRANGHSAVGLRLNNSGDTVMLWEVQGDSLRAAGTVAPVGGEMTSAAGDAPAAKGNAKRLLGETLRLWSGTVLVDSYAYLSHEAEDDRSTGRMPDGGTVWEIFDGLNPYGGSQEPQGNGCLPSPGAQNGCPTPTSEQSWGSVKALYR